MTVVNDIKTELSHHELLTVEKEALCALPHGAHLFIAFSISFNLISLYIFSPLGSTWEHPDNQDNHRCSVSSPWCMSDINQLPFWLDYGIMVWKDTRSLYLFFFFPVAFERDWSNVMYIMYKNNYYDNCRFTCAHLYTYEFGTYADTAVCTYEAKWNGYTHAHTHCDVSLCSQTLHSLIDFTIKLCSVATH